MALERRMLSQFFKCSSEDEARRLCPHEQTRCPFAAAQANYGVLLLISCLPAGQSDARSIAGRVAAALVLTFSCLLYIDAMWVSVSSTSALIFIFAPVYLFVSGLIIWGLAWALFARRTAKEK
jgi:hypothetical protein